MNKKSALFFCALLCSTFAHDLRNAQLSISSQQAKLANNKRLVRSTTSGSTTSYYCTNSDGSVIGMTNTDQNKALVIDISNNISLILIGSSGACVATDLTTNVTKQITGVWLSADTSIDTFISSVDCQSLYNSATVTVDSSSPDDDVNTLVQSVLSSIDDSLAAVLTADDTLGLSLATDICADIQVNLASNINASICSLTSTDLVECGGLTALQATISTIASLQVYLDVDAIADAGVSLSMASILAADSGLTVFADLCVALSAAGLDLSAVISTSVWSDVQVLLNLCIGLGGKLNVGVNGILQVVVNILALIGGSIELDALLTAVINVSMNIDAAIDISTPLTTLQSCLSTQTSTYSSSDALSATVDLVDDLVGSTLVKSDVDISAIVTLLCAGIGTSTIIELVSKVCALLTLNVSVGISVSLLYSTLLRVILELLETAVGRDLVGVLIPEVLSLVSSLVSCVDKLLSSVLSIVLSTEGLVAGLLSVEVTADIYNSCKDAISASANVDLSDCLTDSTAASESAEIETILKTIVSLGC